MDSRTPCELIFDLGLGDVLNICVAGNAMVGPRVLASIEFGCTESGAKLIVVMAHTGSSIMRKIVQSACTPHPFQHPSHGEHFSYLVDNVAASINDEERRRFPALSPDEQQAFSDKVARRHVIRSIDTICSESETLSRLIQDQKVGIIAAVYDTQSGKIEFINDSAIGFDPSLAGDQINHL
jgi:carbonic anhydrase/SulP family sulfate permease